MPALHEVARMIRSKNAGPFLVTIDVMFENEADYRRVVDSEAITPEVVAPRYALTTEEVRVINYAPALAIKITMPRPAAGGPEDTDVAGGQYFVGVLDIEVPVRPSAFMDLLARARRE
jgi:hypothetical protein